MKKKPHINQIKLKRDQDKFWFVYKFNHFDRTINYEIQRQNALKKDLGCKFIRINPDKHRYIFKVMI